MLVSNKHDFSKLITKAKDKIYGSSIENYFYD